MKVQIAIQCIDGRTNQKGSFGFIKERTTALYGKRFYSVTPVFNDLVGLFDYMKRNNIVEDKN